MDNPIDRTALDALRARTQEPARELAQTIQKSQVIQEQPRKLMGSGAKRSSQSRSSRPTPSDPSPAEIAAHCAAIRAGLSERELHQRMRADWRTQSWRVTQDRVADLPGIPSTEDR
jgi:hypothetical protein